MLTETGRKTTKIIKVTNLSKKSRKKGIMESESHKKIQKRQKINNHCFRLIHGTVLRRFDNTLEYLL